MSTDAAVDGATLNGAATISPADEIARYRYTGCDIPALLRQWSQQRGTAIFLQWEPFSGAGASWTYAQFWRDVQSLAAGLHRRGVRHGDRVLIHCGNCPEMLLTWYACATLGAIGVTSNTGATAEEMRHFIAVAEPVVAITQPRFADLVMQHAAGLRWIAVTATNSGESAAAAPAADLIPFEAVFAHGELPPERETEPLLPAGIMYTSGTTGLPKAVVHSHANFLWAGEVGSVNVDFRADDAMLVHFPLFHSVSQLWSVAVALGVGGRCVLMPRISVSRFWPTVVRCGVTHSSAIGVLVQGVADQPVPADHRLREVNMGFVNLELERRWRVRCPGSWGMSEAVIQALRTTLQRDWPAYTVGRPTPGYDMRIVDPDSGRLCGPGESGELWIRGTRGVQLFLEYFRDPQATAASFSDGWFRTGDCFALGADGNYYFKDRLKDVLKVGGENVSAAEVEATILQLPFIAEAAVVAKPDVALDQIPVAFVTLKDAAAGSDALAREVIAHCAARLAKFKVPRTVWFEADLPRSLLGKVAKNRLRDRAAASASAPLEAAVVTDGASLP